MRRITVANKIGAGFAMMGLLLLGLGIVAYLAAASMTRSLEYITGPVWGTSEAASQGMSGVQEQLIAVNRLLQGDDDAKDLLQQAEKNTRQAYQYIVSNDLVSAERLQVLTRSMQNFSDSRIALLAAHHANQETLQRLYSHTAQLQDFLIEIENMASQRLLLHGMRGDEEDLEAEQDDWAAINSVAEARLGLLSHINQFQQYLSGNTEGHAEKLGNYWDDLFYAVEALQADSLFDKPVKNGEFAGQGHGDTLMAMAKRHQQEVRDATESNRKLLQAKEHYRTAAAKLMDVGTSFVAKNTATVNQEIQDFAAVTKTSNITIIATLVLGLLLAVPAYLFNVRAIAVPIRRVAEQLQKLAEGAGDLTVELEVKSNDEIADLARAFNGFTGKQRILIKSLQITIDELNEASAQIGDIAALTGSETQRQQADLSAVATAVTELTASFKEVSGNTAEAANHAKDADTRAAEGSKLVQQTAQAIDSLASEVNSAADTVNILGQQSKDIGGVVDVIRDISEQTNLLALNAAIEAARAGEQGRGFAVVADEVRGLAERTNRSTAEIQKMIDELQNNANQAIEAMQQGAHKASTSVEQARMADDALQQIAGLVNGITGLNTHIAEAAVNQEQTAQDVDQSVISISDAASQNTQRTESLAAATLRLRELSTQLQAMAGQFKVDDDMPAAVNQQGPASQPSSAAVTTANTSAAAPEQDDDITLF